MPPKESSTKTPLEQFKSMGDTERLSLSKSDIRSIIGGFASEDSEPKAVRFIPFSETPPYNDGPVLQAIARILQKNDPAIAQRIAQRYHKPRVLGWYDLTDSALGELWDTPAPKPKFAGGNRRVAIVVETLRPMDPSKPNSEMKSPVFLAYIPPDKVFQAGFSNSIQDAETQGYAYRIGHKPPHELRFLEIGDGTQSEIESKAPPSASIYKARREPQPFATPDGKYNGAGVGGSKAAQVREPVSLPRTASGGEDA